ncbi:isocitrate lyase/phosphoenolpyruvate mutase family protein [Actinospica durhamensis]|uniref:Isocitrate lyase/phosphoenolpyruvate mutase family protein n=2 Tax=Actinospica durhamensis TaxID=1508375 RepID=A0A941IU95_9ACTN|nr:isocitrate lyase/phosphoenolpyruvate mutase family protein [Actinospica durhamensis]
MRAAGSNPDQGPAADSERIRARRAAFAALHHHDAEPLLLPNAWDHASAAALARAGFPAVATTSLGVAASAGFRDGARHTRAATLALARALGDGPYLLSIDAEDGYADEPEDVAEFARELADAGVVGLNLEDGRADGTLTDPVLHAARIAAVKAAVPDLFVNARTDTYWLDVRTEETMGRLVRYREAGADGVFVPGVADAARITELVKGIGAPLNVLYRPGGPNVRELGDLGVRRISLGSLLYRIALGAALDAAESIRQDRSVAFDAPAYAEVQALAGEDGVS